MGTRFLFNSLFSLLNHSGGFLLETMLKHFCAEVTLTEITLISHHGHLLYHLLFLWLHNSRGVLSQLAEESWRLGGIGRRTGAHSAGGGRETHTNHTVIAMWFHCSESAPWHACKKSHRSRHCCVTHHASFACGTPACHLESQWGAIMLLLFQYREGSLLRRYCVMSV